MTPHQIAKWAADGESEALELKRTTGERKEAAKAVCAMLNHRGGRVLIGVEPDGRVIGQEVGDLTLSRLSEEWQRIDPPAFPTLDRVPLDSGLEVLVVGVPQGQNRPYTYGGDCYLRVGSANRRIGAEEYNRLLFERLHSERRWETEEASGWTVADLDASEITRAVDESIRRGRSEDPGVRDPEELLRGLGLIRDGLLLRAAAVLFGRAERLEGAYPQCTLRVARFQGADKTAFLDNRQFHGNAFDLLRRAERFLRENLPVAGRVVPNVFERVDDPLYPPVALREALANALCHRDYGIGGGAVSVAVYDNRLEVASSGSLHFGLTSEALFAPHESLPWNPLIARVFYRVGVIESWGRGTLKMAELTQQAGLRAPEIQEEGGGVVVRFLPSRYVPPQQVRQTVSKRQQAILALLDESGGGLALREIAAAFRESATQRQVREDLTILRALGLAACEGRGRGARWKRL